MSFEYQPTYKERLFYKPNATSVYKFPAGNIFAGIDMLLRLKVNILTSVSSNVPDFQIFNAIERVQLFRNSTQLVWDVSGQGLALMFTYDKKGGTAAKSNATIAGAVANGVVGQHFLGCKFQPDDALKPYDFAIDTRGNSYELHIKWRDLTVAGTLFGTIGTSITTTDTDNYLDIELKNLALRPSPIDGAPDALTNSTPLCMAIRENREEINADNAQYEIKLPSNQDFRNVILFTTHLDNTLQEVGKDTVLSGRVKLYDTQNRVKQDRLVTMLKESTSQRWGLGSGVPGGLYDVNITPYGQAGDVIRSNSITDLRLGLSVTKLANPTYVRTIYVTQENQVAA